MFENLMYSSDGKSVSIPSWVLFYLNLGYHLNNLIGEIPFTVGIIAPTNIFAAPLIASGFVLSKMEHGSGSDDQCVTVDQLRELELGTELVYRQGDRRIKGRFEGITPTHIQIAPMKGETRWYLLESLPQLQIQISYGKQGKVSRRRVSRTSKMTDPFLQVLIPDMDQAYFSFSRTECIIVCNLLTISSIANQAGLLVQDTDGNRCQCMLESIFGIKPATSAPLKEYHSELRRNLDHPVQEPLVIFDNAKRFLDSIAQCERANYVVVLDRTDERHLEEAVGRLKRDFNDRNEKRLFLDVSIPESIEMTAFYRDGGM